MPEILQERIGNMKVAAGVMSGKGIPFVLSVSRGINFTTVEYASQRLNTILANSIGNIFQFYKIMDILLKTFLTNKGSECIYDSLPGTGNLKKFTTNEYVPDIELKNRVIKECTRSLISTFPFNNIPGRIIIELIWFLGIWINQEPSYNILGPAQDVPYALMIWYVSKIIYLS